MQIGEHFIGERRWPDPYKTPSRMIAFGQEPQRDDAKIVIMLWVDISSMLNLTKASHSEVTLASLKAICRGSKSIMFCGVRIRGFRSSFRRCNFLYVHFASGVD